MKTIEMITSDNKITQAWSGGKNYKCLRCEDEYNETYEWQRKNLDPDSRYACVLIKIPEGYRLATEEDKGDIEHKYIDNISDGWKDAHRIWDTDLELFINAVPLEIPKDTKRKELEDKLEKARQEIKSVEEQLRRSI